MKTYQLCFAACCNAECKYKVAESQKNRFEEAFPKKIGYRKHKALEKELEKVFFDGRCFQREGRFMEFSMKALKARNDYLLCIDAANAALHKYFADDLSDLIDTEDCQNWAQNLDIRADKQRFLESNHSLFVLPRKFEFRPQNGDEMRHVSAQKSVQDDLIQRVWQLQQRLLQLRTESEEVRL
ncbi:unnamed protein product [Soboliphyme baturini]|uniref:DUF4435 domain-containing protein n=1 Tax=Soboliphyme baturini TaxID=241478 RepID=A0A183IUN9_9BILA|nr:unnamed protein product [Soboliphyme baturini]